MNKRKYQELLSYRKSQEIMLFHLIKMCKDKYSPREIVKMVGIPYKRALYILDKWTVHKIYSYGVSLDMGWVETDKYNIK